MRTFKCVITDTRHSEPLLSFYMTSDGERARELARRALRANPHHEKIEVREGGRVLFVEGR